MDHRDRLGSRLAGVGLTACNAILPAAGIRIIPELALHECLAGYRGDLRGLLGETASDSAGTARSG